MTKHLLGAAVLTLLAVTVVFAAGYHWLMFGLEFGGESLTEDLNYALQTATTVGYGNWVPTTWDLGNEDVQTRVLRVKALSVPFMLVGGSLFAVLVGLVSNFLSRR